MKKTIVHCLLVGFLFFFQSSEVLANEPATFPVSGQAAILMEQSSGRVLYSKNEHQPLKIASITKIMTAILAIESGKLDETVTVSKRAEGTEGSSLYLVAGEKLTLRDLVYGLMLRSGNDAAIAIAEHVGGSVEGFVFLMNEKAEEIGMSNTLFRNPHGLDTDEDHLSSAYDMALLTQYAMGNEEYRDISSTKDYRSKGDKVRVFHNKNRLLTEKYSYSTGGKTGYTKLAKRTLVSTASKDGLDLIAVTLNAPDDWDDHMHMFNWGFEHYSLERLVSKGKLKSKVDPFYEGNLYVPYDVVYPLTREEKSQLQSALTLKNPPKRGKFTDQELLEPIGKLAFTVDGKTIESIPLYYQAQEEEHVSLFQKIGRLLTFIIGVRPL
ncbi:D-alanyl-D-alanine carboxypeptidase family protein [Shouchella clausii]|uniref:D-alanyl-D-alanine carboxypeptidase family protein n=1 Tax=Shouchella TaxID=2893057 RepID=UPI0004E6AAAC|nr:MULTISPECIES: D-alanyl-D-alanine carboxypeptidase family protein [Shouchella]ALA50990.1 D-alanyl-D-alanine carboxypeptidase [Shouchella clausii]MBU3231792.1 D-alanyl-D-alanine carboxypeptidase [Shouchella clausii]MBU3264924.1 D-alanyl-D-alanine carboxypeptidase [Shouchella clausii]MBU3507613.1 D-alanyl-D-alanine carboxypeptidase [Shouchella clausii]MBU3535824.1 D-alanyl-D-alanine carboxypeptidase [Shouchella clausii]